MNNITSFIQYNVELTLLIGIIIFLYIFYKISKTIYNRLFNNIERFLLFKRLESIVIIYETKRDVAFNSLFKRKLSGFYTSNVSSTIKKEQILENEKKFINIVIELCGPHIMEDLYNIYGGTDSIVRDLSEYYSLKIIELEKESFELELKEKFSEDFGLDDPDLVRKKNNFIFIK